MIKVLGRLRPHCSQLSQPALPKHLQTCSINTNNTPPQVNCGFTAAYSLYLRGTMDRVKAVTATGEKLNEASMVGRCICLRGAFI